MKRQQEILPIKYYHVVFTLPPKLNDLIKNHPRLLYNILFRAAWYSLKKLLADSEWCGAEAGMLAVLHTWGQNLSFHPHLHCIVPAGGLSADQKLALTRHAVGFVAVWIYSSKSSLLELPNNGSYAT